jgi:replication-associated recombination protein RarA
VRRGLEHDALHWAVELDRSGYGEFAFERLRVMAMEDIGLADPNVIVQVQALYQVWTDLRKKREDKNEPWRLALVMATMVCAKAAKSRAVDHALLAFYGEDEVREIPDGALDKHTSRGWELKRGWKHFWDESTLLLDRKTGELAHEPIPDPYRARAIKVTRGKGKTRAVSTLTQER